MLIGVDTIFLKKNFKSNTRVLLRDKVTCYCQINKNNKKDAGQAKTQISMAVT